MGKVRVAIVGVGNCASSLVQGLEYYKDADDAARVPGLMHVRFGDYHVSDVEVVAAFDVDAKKVGRDLAEAIFASENNTIKFAEVPPSGVTVQRGHTFDGLGEYYREIITESDEPAVDVVAALREARADVLVSYLPVGSEQADRFYAQCAIDAKVGFVNALPVFIASDPAWAKKFTDAGVPIVGDDIKSQVGATITHRVLAKLFEDRGVELLRTYQLNFGGNMDFMNMLERKRLQSKKISKTQSVTSQIPHEMAKADVHIGPSDHVPWLDDRKWAYVRLEGRSFGDTPLSLEYKLEVWDSPNSAGVIIDAIRAAKIAKDRGIGGPIISASSYFLKSPARRFKLCSVTAATGAEGGRRSSFGADLREVLAERDFRKLFASRLVSQTGDGVFNAGFAAYAFFSAQSFPNPVAAVDAFAVLYLPYSLIGPFAGVFIDRWSRRQIIVYGALIPAAMVAVAGFVVLSGQTGIPLYISALAVLAVNRFFLSAVSAGTPHVVSHDKLVMANAVVPTAGTILGFVGGVVGLGVHFISGGGLAGSAAVLWFGGACYLVAGLLGTRMGKDLLGPLETEKALAKANGLAAELGGVVHGLVAGIKHLNQRRQAAYALGA